MSGFTHHTPKPTTQTGTAAWSVESLLKALELALLAKRLAEHPHYSGA